MAAFLSRLDAISPKGYAAGIHIRFAAPLYLRSTFPQSWQDTYREKAYSLRDPVLFWGVSQTGTIRWSESKIPDPFKVMEDAARHGLVYGASASVGKITSRSVVGIARDDREFGDDEIAELLEATEGLHAVTEPPADLEPQVIDALRLTSEGYRPAEVAAHLGIEEAELLRRLESAQVTLGAGSTAQAIQLAREYRLM
jgi:LuxR family transcriptional regulator